MDVATIKRVPPCIKFQFLLHNCCGDELNDKSQGAVLEILTLFILGASIYCVLEVLWRGYTHWSMGLAGGVSLCMLGKCRDLLLRWHFLMRCVAGTGIITAIEFLTGCVVNLWLGWSVWDYSHHALNILAKSVRSFSFSGCFCASPAMRFAALFAMFGIYCCRIFLQIQYRFKLDKNQQNST